jgi:hypothetical protein
LARLLAVSASWALAAERPVRAVLRAFTLGMSDMEGDGARGMGGGLGGGSGADNEDSFVGGDCGVFTLPLPCGKSGLGFEAHL